MGKFLIIHEMIVVEVADNLAEAVNKYNKLKREKTGLIRIVTVIHES